jgi:hypothetical protein
LQREQEYAADRFGFLDRGRKRRSPSPLSP